MNNKELVQNLRYKAEKYGNSIKGIALRVKANAIEKNKTVFK